MCLWRSVFRFRGPGCSRVFAVKASALSSLPASSLHQALFVQTPVFQINDEMPALLSPPRTEASRPARVVIFAIMPVLVRMVVDQDGVDFGERRLPRV
jgi:hypothetical protein